MVKVALFTLCLMSSPLFCEGQTNRALFIAIDNYPPKSGWNQIHSTNDAKVVIPMLKYNGFSTKNITCLINEQATKQAIVTKLSHFCTHSKKGDHLYIHFSGHGQQMIDDNGDEDDGLDEALIPYNAQQQFSAGVYEGQNHLRDDKLGSFIEQMRAKIGPLGKITLVLDACHSGTANRGQDQDLYIRGTSVVFAPYDYLRSTKTASKKRLKLQTNPRLGAVTVFSACQPDQINYEYFNSLDNRYYGTLSYTISEILTEPNQLTVLQVYTRIESRIKSLFSSLKIKQIPYLETTDENQPFKIGR